MNTTASMHELILRSETDAGNTSLRNTKWARRIEKREMPKPKTEQQKAGLRYERNVVKALRNRGLDLEHNPWFEYWSRWSKKSKLGAIGHCCPDIVVYELSQNRAIVIEVKLTYTPEALSKLRTLYCPVVECVTGLKSVPLVIFKNSVNDKRVFIGDFYAAVNSAIPFYQWLGRGLIV